MTNASRRRSRRTSVAAAPTRASSVPCAERPSSGGARSRQTRVPALPDGGAGASAGLRPRHPWDLCRLEERDYFDVLPEGLVVVLEPAQDPSAGWTTSFGAWLHLGVDGVATAFTGKVDVGQDNRTALSLLVAEELRLPLDAVRLVMGDTDVCPHDLGTFGSRSIPDAGELLWPVAAAARECLVRLAADALGSGRRGAPGARRHGPARTGWQPGSLRGARDGPAAGRTRRHRRAARPRDRREAGRAAGPARGRYRRS